MSVTTDYYAVLGVRRDAVADEIKMAYRRLARELHPDVNPDPVAREQFKEVTQAHQVLSDPAKRQMYDLGGDPFAAASGYFGQARGERSKRDGYPRDRWESDREGWPSHPSDGAWNQPWDQAPYSDYLGGLPPSFSHDWRLPPAVKPYRPRPIPVAVALMCVVLAFATLFVTHRPDLHSTPMTTMKPIWAPPPPGAAPAMTGKQAWLTFNHGVPMRTKVQLGLITAPIGPAHCGTACDGYPVHNGIAYKARNQLAYRYYWTSCSPPTNRPASDCWNWVFLNANTGQYITGASYHASRDP